MRVCTTCLDPWPDECFSVDRRQKGGRRRECNACRAERRAELAAGAPRRKPWGSRRAWTFAGSARRRAQNRASKARAQKR